MINLNETPEKVLTLVDGEHVTVDGIELVVTVDDFDWVRDPISNAPKIYLTTVDSRIDEYNELNKLSEDGYNYPEYSEYIRHLRDVLGLASMSKEHMVDTIKTKQYMIG
jgi:hypothetical protein